MEREDGLGRRIRQAREKQGLTSADLARLIGVSRSLINQIERGSANPSMQTFNRIADALQVSRHSLLEEVATQTAVVARADRRQRFRWPPATLEYEVLNPVDSPVDLLRIECAPDDDWPIAPLVHPGQECLFVVEGVVHVTVDGQEYVLQPGDSMCYDCGLPHRLHNLEKRRVSVIMLIIPAIPGNHLVPRAPGLDSALRNQRETLA